MEQELWVKSIRDSLPYMLYLPANVFGKVKSVHPHEENGRSGDAYHEIIEFEDGNTFFGKPENFKVLTVKQAQFFLQVQSTLGHVIRELPKLARALGVDQGMGTTLIRSALSKQLVLLNPTTSQLVSDE